MSTAQSVVKSDKQSRIADAVHRAQAYLSAQQNLEGYWWAELEANVTLTAEYVMLHRIRIGGDQDAVEHDVFGGQRDVGFKLRPPVPVEVLLGQQAPAGALDGIGNA